MREAYLFFKTLEKQYITNPRIIVHAKVKKIIPSVFTF